MVTIMSNSSRIEQATRQHIGAVLTSKMIVELVKVAFPEDKSGVYPSDAAHKRGEDGLVPRGKVAYGDGILEFLAENSFKVLPTEEIVRKPTKRVAKPAAATTPEVPAAPAVAAAPVEAQQEVKPTVKKKGKKSKKQAA
jgi:hypothetical protein